MINLKPNILFCVVDSLRSDRCYGKNKSSVTPNIDMMIKNGIFFTHSISSVASTSVSLGSIFTGLFPFKTGMSDTKYEKLDPNIPNFIDLLKKEGYSTHATSSEINESLGITVDFDFKINLNEYNNYLGLFNGLGERIIQKLSDGMKEPWFFYIHIYDLHQPIIIPKEFDEKKYGITQYDRMVSAIDIWLGRILDVVDTNKTLLVLTADHGDYVRSIVRDGEEVNLETSAFEKLLWKLGNKLPPSFDSYKQKFAKTLHSFRSRTRKMKTKNLELTPYERRILETTRMDTGNHLYDDVLVVPLILHGMNINEYKIINQQIRSVDIFPTMMDLLGFEHKYKTDGITLKPLIKGKPTTESLAYIESMPAINENNEKLVGLRTSEFKYIRSKNTSIKKELYNLKNDPFEENNIANTHSEIIDKMEQHLVEILKEQHESSESLDKENRKKVERELRKLGYI